MDTIDYRSFLYEETFEHRVLARAMGQAARDAGMPFFAMGHDAGEEEGRAATAFYDLLVAYANDLNARNPDSWITAETNGPWCGFFIRESDDGRVWHGTATPRLDRAKLRTLTEVGQFAVLSASFNDLAARVPCRRFPPPIRLEGVAPDGRILR